VASQAHLGQIGWTPPPAGGRRPVVAVLDTGVDPATPDLAGVLLTGAARSFVPGRPALGDPDGHGTHVAGLIAAASGNGIGGSGVAAARIIPITIADASGRTTTSALVRGLKYASARGARVINVSFGGRGFSRLEQDAVDAAVRRGALVVAAAGNTGARGGPPDYPGAYRQVMAVGALAATGAPLALSARGPQIAVAAPGEGILSTAPPRLAAGAANGLVARTGTSMAAAIVSGAAARIMAERPRLSAQQVRTLIETTASDVPPGGRDPATGAGALDLAAALAAPPPPREDPEPNDDTALAALWPPLLGPAGRASVARGRTGGPGDPRDGLRVVLRAGQSLEATLSGPAAADLDLVVWRPGTPATRRTPAFARTWLAAASLGPASAERITLRATIAGAYTVEVGGTRGPASYVLTVRRRA
jgi:subtilisin family serine protease